MRKSTAADYPRNRVPQVTGEPRGAHVDSAVDTDPKALTGNRGVCGASPPVRQTKSSCSSAVGQGKGLWVPWGTKGRIGFLELFL